LEIKKDLSVGSIIFDKTEKKYFLIKQTNGHWGFPKGHPNKNETFFETAKRELKEESGLDLEIFLKNKNNELKTDILFRDYYEFSTQDLCIKKEVFYFLLILEKFEKNDSLKINLQETEIADFCWASFKNSKNLFSFEETKKLLKNVHNFLECYFKKK
jgi:bis(5'-nucleosidyl)-tetraphosphatase